MPIREIGIGAAPFGTALIDPFFGASMKRLTARFLSSDAGKITLLLALILSLALGGIGLSKIVSARMLRAGALSTSASWAANLDDTVDDLPAIAAGLQPTDESRRLLAAAGQVGDIYRYRIWDPSGQLAFKSERIPSSDVRTDLSSLLGQRSAVTILSGTELTESRSGTSPENPDYFAVSFIPVRRGGNLICVFEVYLDQTADKALYEHSFFLTESIMAIIVLLAGALPAFMVYRKMQVHRGAREAHTV